MVARSFFGLDKKPLMSLAFFDCSLFILVSSFGLSAKKATSAPDISADVISKPISIIMAIMLSLLKGLRAESVIIFNMGKWVNV